MAASAEKLVNGKDDDDDEEEEEEEEEEEKEEEDIDGDNDGEVTSLLSRSPSFFIPLKLFTTQGKGPRVIIVSRRRARGLKTSNK